MDYAGLKKEIDDLCVEIVNVSTLISNNHTVFRHTKMPVIKEAMMSQLRDNVRLAVKLTNGAKKLLQQLFTLENEQPDLKYRRLYRTLCENQFPNI